MSSDLPTRVVETPASPGRGLKGSAAAVGVDKPALEDDAFDDSGEAPKSKNSGNGGGVIWKFFFFSVMGLIGVIFVGVIGHTMGKACSQAATDPNKASALRRRQERLLIEAAAEDRKTPLLLAFEEAYKRGQQDLETSQTIFEEEEDDDEERGKGDADGAADRVA